MTCLLKQQDGALPKASENLRIQSHLAMKTKILHKRVPMLIFTDTSPRISWVREDILLSDNPGTGHLSEC